MAREYSARATEASAAVETSYWPIVLAAALTLTLAGLVTHIALTALGALIALVALVAWTLQRFTEPGDPARVAAERLHLPALDVGEGEVEAPLEVGRRPGWWGLVWFISTEALFFANMLAAYLYLRVSSGIWPPPGTPHLDLGFASVNTVILLLSGLPAYYAERAIARGDRRGLQIGLVLAALLGAIFLAGQGYEYTTIGLTPGSSVFAAGFFTLTGFHGIHVVAGIGLLLFVLFLSLRGHFSAQRHFAVEVASTYWHFVDVVWIFLFSILYVLQ